MTPGQSYTCTVASEDIGGNPADTQLFQTTTITPNENTTLTPTYTVTVTNTGTGFANADEITILGSKVGGAD